MISHSENQLTEGVRYLTGHDASYNPEIDKKKYTFQFIEESLTTFKLEKYIKNIIEIIVFDALVGNSDRHQENWGVIVSYKDLFENVESQVKANNSIVNNFLNIAFYFFIKNKAKIPNSKNVNDLKFEAKIIPNYFAPIYDSGCCLGREFEEIKIERIINDNCYLERYVSKKGFSEIH